MASVVQDAAFIPNAELYAFHCTSAFTQFVAGWEASGKPFQVEAVPEELPSAEGCVPSDVLNDVAYEYGLLKFKAGDIYNTCRSIQGAYIDLLAKEKINGNKKLWAIGPIIPETCQLRNSINRHKCLEWLANQSPKSVIYVSFGTTISLADEQIKELAFGLEQSGQKFIWVLRDADKGDIFDGEDRRVKLPEGFEERVEGVGMAVRDWAPQPQILGHPSTGGFMCHCGSNSCMESITVGVPIAAWPMHSDQPRNTALVTQDLGVGIVVRSWEHREELVISSTIEKPVQRLMGSKEGDEIRKRAEELGSAVWQSTDIGGVSRRELDSFIAHIVSKGGARILIRPELKAEYINYVKKLNTIRESILEKSISENFYIPI